MDKLTQAIIKKFGEKYSFLKLFDVVYDTGLKVCSVTFLFPFDMEDLDSASRDEITLYVREFLSLYSKVRVKFKKSFLDEKLIKQEIHNFFQQEHKGLNQYIEDDNIVLTKEQFEINIDICLNRDVLTMMDTGTIRQNLKNFLDRRFIANFDIQILENEEELPKDIDFVDIVDFSPAIQRYDIDIIGKLLGGEIAPKPEYIRNMTKPKSSVILAGKISALEKKAFIVKSGKREGTEKYLYKFKLTDEDSIDCIYFCTKSNERKLDSLKEGKMIVCVGDITMDARSGKLVYKPRKISFASTHENLELNNIQKNAGIKHKQVVFPEPMQIISQSNLFLTKPKYNDFIMSNTIVVYDLETTGLSHETCEIIEIGAVKIVNGEIKERFASFVKPKSPIPADATAKNNITDEMVKDAPCIEDVIADFYDYTRGCVLSGYNIIGFDMKFLQKAGSKVGLKFDNQVIDAYIVAMQSHLRTHNFKLGTVAAALGVSLKDAHRAYNDAYATAQVLLELSKVK